MQKCHLLYPTHSSAIAPVSINMRGTETKMFVLDKEIQNASFQMYEDCSMHYMYFIATKWNQICYEHPAEIWETRQERPLILTTGRVLFIYFISASLTTCIHFNNGKWVNFKTMGGVFKHIFPKRGWTSS